MDSENDKFFEQVYKNPNTEIGVKLPSKTTIHGLLNNIGFRGKAKALFFQASKGKVTFRNPIKKSDLVELGLENITLEKIFPWVRDSDAK